MAPKQKAAEGGQASSGGKAGNSDRQGNSERGGHGHSNGASASERGSGAGNDRSASGTGHGDKASSGAASGSGVGTKRKAEGPLITVDFADMDMAALRRYCRLNRLKPKSKAQEDLVAAATKHWNSVNAKEVDSVAYFLYAVKHRHNVLKFTMPLP
ncbi:hypothetical protein BGX34_010482 [Mortierella sp. NVP85]|nr:hypothetical protein BGX34_010482 [Mortierella sp. NVP85]